MITNRDWPVIAENEAEEFPSKMRTIVQGLAEFTDEANALGGELNTSRDQGVQTIEQARDDSVVTLNGYVQAAQGHKDAAQQSETNAQTYASQAEQAKNDAQSAAAGNVIDDSTASALKAYSSQKVDAELAQKQGVSTDKSPAILSYDMAVKTNTANAVHALDVLVNSSFVIDVPSDTTLSFVSNASQTGTTTLKIVLNITGAPAVTWPTSVQWPTATAPSIDAGKMVFAFTTSDGGTTWEGTLVGAGYA